MKIRELRLRNFRSHRDTSVSLDHVNVFLGANAAGKTSIKAAIEWALTGRNQFTDRRGAGAGDLVRRGETQASVELVIEDDRLGGARTLTRSLPADLAIEGWAGSPTRLEGILHTALGVDADLIGVAMNTSAFLDMDPGKQKDVLFALSGVRLATLESVAHELVERFQVPGAQGCARPHFGVEEVTAYLRRLMPAGAENGGADLLLTLEELARDHRRLVKKQLQTATTQHDMAAREPSALPSGVTLDRRQEVIDSLVELKAQREQLLRSSGEARARAQRRQEVAVELASQRRRLELADEACEACAAEVPAGVDLAALEAQAVVVGEDLELWARKRADVDKAAHEAEGRVQALKVLCDGLQSFDGRCPLAPDDIACKADISGLAARVGEQLTRAAETSAELQHRATQVSWSRDDALKQHDEVQRQIRQVRQALQDVEAARANRDALAQRVASLEAELDAAKDLPDIDSIETRLATLAQRIQRGEGILEAMRREEARVARLANMQKALADAQAAVAEAEQYVDALGPDGLRAALLAETIDQLQTAANDTLARLTCEEYQLRFEVGEGFRVIVSHGDVETDLRHLSTSERLRVGIVLQDTLNSLTGLRLLVIDDCEVLDPENTDLLVKTLWAIRAEYDTIILLASARHEIRDPGIAGLAMFAVVDGSVARVQALAA